jgi:MFS family permease
MRAEALNLAVATAVGSTGLAAGGTAGALIAAELTGGSAAAGLPLGAVVVGSAAGALLISRVTRRTGRIAGLVLGYAIGGVGAVLVVAATVAASLGLVIAGNAVMGVANAAVFLTRYAAADAGSGRGRGRALGFVLAGAAVGAVAGPNLLGPSGELAAGLGLPRFTGLYLVAAVAFPAAAGLLALHRRSAPNRAVPAPPRPHRNAGAAIVVLALTNLVMVAVMAVAPLHMLAHGHDLDLVGVAISVHVLFMFAPAPLAGWLADRTSPLVVAGIGAVLLAAGGTAGAMVDPRSAVAFTVVLAVVGLGWGAGVVAGSTMLVASVPEPARPRAEGIGEVVMGVAAGAGAPLAGLMVAVGGFSALVLTLAATSLAMLLWGPLVASSRRSRGIGELARSTVEDEVASGPVTAARR